MNVTYSTALFEKFKTHPLWHDDFSVLLLRGSLLSLSLSLYSLPLFLSLSKATLIGLVQRSAVQLFSWVNTRRHFGCVCRPPVLTPVVKVTCGKLQKRTFRIQIRPQIYVPGLKKKKNWWLNCQLKSNRLLVQWSKSYWILISYYNYNKKIGTLIVCIFLFSIFLFNY